MFSSNDLILELIMISKKEITRMKGRVLRSLGVDLRYHDGGLWEQK